MAQYFQIVQNVDELKRICPNINLERLQVVSVSGDEVGTLNQQIILAPDDQLVLNDNQVSQIVYQQQQPPQQQVPAQRGATHFIIQDEDNANATQQQQIYYSAETESDQITQQHQQNQMVQTTQQQVVLRHVSAANSQQQQQHQQLLVHKTHDPNTRQQVPTPVLMDQSQATSGHAHVIVQQQSQQLVLQPQHQQTAVQTQGNASQTPQTSSIVMRQQVPGSNLGQQRIIYTHPSRTVVFTQPIQQQQQHALPHHTDSQSNQPQTSEVSAPHRVIRQTNIQHHSPIQNIIFTPVQSPQNQGQQIQQQSPPQSQQNQQSQSQQLTNQQQTPLIRTPQASRTTQNRMVLNPRFPHQARQNIRLNIVQQSPTATTVPTPVPPTPPTKPARGRQSTGRGRGGRGRHNSSAQNKAAKAAASTSVNNPVNPQVSTASVQTQVSTVQTQQTQATSAASRIYSSQATQAAIQQHRLIASQVHQRLIGPQRSQMSTPNIIANFSPQNQPRFRSQATISAKIVNTSYPTVSDIEDSIQAVVVTKSMDAASSSVTSTATSEPKSHLNTTLTSYYTDNNPDERKEIQLQNGRVMSLAEYKRMQKQSKPLKSIPSTNRANTTIPVNRVAPMQATTINKTVQPPPMISEENRMQQQRIPVVTQSQTQTPPQIQQPLQHAIVHAPRNQLQIQEGDTQKSARMLVILSTGEQRLITFTLPKESCTVQELLEQVGVPFTSKTNINCVSNPGANIDYVVSVGMAVPESTSELISAAEQTLQLSKQQIMDTPVQQITDPSQSQQQSHSQSLSGQSMQMDKLPVETKEVSTKIIQGFLAVCQSCGYSGNDHAKCERRVFHEEPKRVPYSKNFANKIEDERKRQNFPAELMNKAASKAIASVTSHRGRGGLTAIRGRGRGVPRSKPEPVEPVILTLSSDEEDDEKSNQSVKTPPTNTPALEQTPLPCEPTIPEDDGFLNYNRENVADVANVSDKLVASLTCKLIRIGTHRYEPREKVLFTTKGVKIVAPNCANPDENVVLNIQTREIVKIIAHFSKGLPILFIYTLPRCGIYIRESLDMKPKDSTDASVYYNPTDRSEPYKRIVLQVDTMSEDSKSVIKAIFATSVLEEISCNDANELLLRSCSKDKKLKNESGSVALKVESTDIRQILIYPPGKGGISINTEDYMCLAIDQYLNDIIIDFYLKYLHTNVLSEEQREKTHIFSSFFYKRLTTMTSRQRHNEKDTKLTAAQKRHARVKSWTKNVNLFEKDFIIIPINEQSHWFLAIICFPKLKGPVNFDTMDPVNLEPNNPKKKKSATGKVSQIQIGNTTITPLSKRDLDSVCVGDDSMSERDEAEGDESDLASDESESESNAAAEANEEQPQRIKQPLILIFDSLSGASRSRVVATLRDYLTCEYKAKIKEDSLHSFTKWNMPGQCVKVPQQNNFTDCGLYLLQYVEHFFKDPIRDYRLPIKQLVNWFETIVVTRKREEISNLLRDLVEQLNPEKLPLPDIAFPTINGKLVEQDDSFIDEQAEFEEEEMEDEFEEEDDEEVAGDTEGETSPEKVQNGSGQRRDILKRPLETHVLDNSVRKTARLDHTV